MMGVKKGVADTGLGKGEGGGGLRTASEVSDSLLSGT